MKLTVLHNHLDDCLLYVDGITHSDIDYRDGMCLKWLKEVVQDKVEIQFIYREIERQYYPEHYLEVGDKIFFVTDKRSYTVKATNELFTICTKPLNIHKTCLYTIIDWRQHKRNRNNMIFNPYDYMKQEDIDQCLKDLTDPEHVTEISHRGAVKLDIVRVVKRK